MQALKLSCKHGHVGQFREDGRCMQCNRDSAKRSASRNKERVVKRAVEWNRAHQEKRSAISKKYYDANRESCLARGKSLRGNDPSRELARCRRRQADKLKRTPPWADMDAIREIYRECRRVSEKTGVKHHVDHIIPLRGRLVSGLHVAENLQIIPAFENLSKGRRFRGVW